MEDMHGNIPNLFEYGPDMVLHLLLQKNAMAHSFKCHTNITAKSSQQYHLCLPQQRFSRVLSTRLLKLLQLMKRIIVYKLYKISELFTTSNQCCKAFLNKIYYCFVFCCRSMQQCCKTVLVSSHADSRPHMLTYSTFKLTLY